MAGKVAPAFADGDAKKDVIIMQIDRPRRMVEDGIGDFACHLIGIEGERLVDALDIDLERRAFFMGKQLDRGVLHGF